MSDPANCIPWKHYKPLFKQLVKRGIYTEAELDMQTQRHGELQLGYAVSFGDRIGALMFADDAETRRLIDTVATRKWRDTSAYRNIIRADAMAGDPALVEAVEWVDEEPRITALLGREDHTIFRAALRASSMFGTIIPRTFNAIMGYDAMGDLQVLCDRGLVIERPKGDLELHPDFHPELIIAWEAFLGHSRADATQHPA